MPAEMPALLTTGPFVDPAHAGAHVEAGEHGLQVVHVLPVRGGGPAVEHAGLREQEAPWCTPRPWSFVAPRHAAHPADHLRLFERPPSPRRRAR